MTVTCDWQRDLRQRLQSCKSLSMTCDFELSYKENEIWRFQQFNVTNCDGFNNSKSQFKVTSRHCRVYTMYIRYINYTANPTWGDIFECCFKAQSSKLERLFSLKRGKRDVRALSFELSKMTPQVGLAVHVYNTYETVTRDFELLYKQHQLWRFQQFKITIQNHDSLSRICNVHTLHTLYMYTTRMRQWLVTLNSYTNNTNFDVFAAWNHSWICLGFFQKPAGYWMHYPVAS